MVLYELIAALFIQYARFFDLKLSIYMEGKYENE